MLLRASRASELLTKEAIVGRLISTGAKWGTRGAIGAGRRLGKAAWKHKKALGVGGLVTAFPAMEASEAIGRGNVGMNPQWTSARMQGRVPRVPQM